MVCYLEAVGVTSEYPQDSGLVCYLYDCRVDPWDIAELHGALRLAVIGCLIFDTHNKSTHKMVAVGKRLGTSIC